MNKLAHLLAHIKTYGLIAYPKYRADVTEWTDSFHGHQN